MHHMIYNKTTNKNTYIRECGRGLKHVAKAGQLETPHSNNNDTMRPYVNEFVDVTEADFESDAGHETAIQEACDTVPHYTVNEPERDVYSEMYHRTANHLMKQCGSGEGPSKHAGRLAGHVFNMNFCSAVDEHHTGTHI